MNKFEALKCLIESLNTSEKKVIITLLQDKKGAYIELFRALRKKKGLEKKDLVLLYKSTKALENDIDYLENILFKALRWFYEDNENYDESHHFKSAMYFNNIEISRIKHLNYYLEKNIRSLNQHATKYQMSFWKAMALSYEFYVLSVKQEKDANKYHLIVEELQKTSQSFVNARRLYALSYELNNEINIYQYQKNKDINKYLKYLELPILKANQKFEYFQEQNMYHSCRANIFLLLNDNQSCISEASSKLLLFKADQRNSITYFLSYYVYGCFLLSDSMLIEKAYQHIIDFEKYKPVDNNKKLSYYSNLRANLLIQYYLLINKPSQVIEVLSGIESIPSLEAFQNIYKAISNFRLQNFREALRSSQFIQTEDIKLTYYQYFIELLCCIELDNNEDILMSKTRSIERKIKKNYLFYDAFMPFIKFCKTVNKSNFSNLQDLKYLLIEVRAQESRSVQFFYKEFGIIDWIQDKINSTDAPLLKDEFKP